MAEAVLLTIGTSLASGLLKSLMQKSVDALSKTSSATGLKFAIFGNLEEQLSQLKPELEKLDALCSAPVHPNPNAFLRNWLKRVNEAATFADNLLDDISYEQTQRQVESNAVSNLLLRGSDGSLAFRIKIGRKLSKLMSMIADIYKEGHNIGLRPVEVVENPSSYQPPAAMSADLREIREIVDTSFVVGRKADEELIVGELCRPNNNKVLGVISIVGMSGVGKTTLARKIYDNPTMAEQYKKKIWIFVSDNFDLRKILAEMLQSLTTEVNTDASVSGVPNIDALEKKLQRCLEKERYLLVLDDVWNKNQQVWDSIRTSLLRVANGCTGSSMVLVTTQLKDVASVMGAHLIHDVKLLSEDDSRELFKGKAFANKRPELVSDLRDIGERILSKCGGLPLAINTLASLLATMNDRIQWESVERSQLWNLPEGHNTIMPWLLLSFNHLPNAAMKQCFLHCSILIPKGYDAEKSYLISSWIAQGFIQQSETSDQDLLAIGRLYFKSMLAHGLLQLYSDDGYSQHFSMHDLAHDLAVYVCGDKYLTIREPNDLHNASSGVEHVFIDGLNTFTSQLKFPKGNTRSVLRTLICHCATISIDLVVVEARFLCELELYDCSINEIPGSIGSLKHLRRFVFNGSPIKYLPESIGSLYNLQVLHLERCDRLVELPQQVTKLLNLREIYTTVAVQIPKGLGQLTRLTKLHLVKLKAGDGCRIKELGRLKNLAGILEIKQLENISCKEDAMAADLKKKTGIEVLKLEWSSDGNEGDMICTNVEEVMEGLIPHSNLKELLVVNFRAKRFSLWLSSGLHCINLTELTLVNCKRCEQLPTLGCLPSLKYLCIEGMESVEVIESDFFACSNTGIQSNLFPSLEEFKLWNMLKLREWFGPLGPCASAFPCLQILDMKDCPALVSVPSCFHSLQQLHIEGMNSSEPLLMILSSSYKLTSLTVENIRQLTCLSEPLLKCTSLRLLKITGCKELVELALTLQSLACLETLLVENCDSLTSLPDIECLLSLKDLEIAECEQITDTPGGLESCVSIERLILTSCPNLKFNPELVISSSLQLLGFYNLSKQMSVPLFQSECLNHFSNLTETTIGGFNKELDNIRGIQHLPKSLKKLYLVGWPKLKSLPGELQSFTQLETLALWEFDGVTSLPDWLDNLSSLQSLEILNCKNMKHLPSPEAIQRLTRLGELKIEGCPLLEERCREEGGEEWHKISHLPRIQIIEADAKAPNYDVQSSELVEAEMEVEAALQVTIGSSLASGLVKALLLKSANIVLSQSPSAAGYNKSALFGNLESQLAQLKRELEKLDGLLCSVERLSPAHHNRNALLLQWVGRINKAANFAENLLDDIFYEQIRRKMESNTMSPRSVGRLGIRIKIGRRLSECVSMIADIYKEAAKIGIKPVELVENLRENGETSVFVGRKADEELIVDELCRPNNDSLLAVIAIVGISGVGKTTLARKIYNNKIVAEQYKNKSWISVTFDFNLRRLLDEMLLSFTGVNHNILSTDVMENKIKSCLQKERYLVVLDDVWNTNKQVWDSIRTSLVRLADGCTGTSMVVVTTQLEEVASIMGASLTHYVNILSEYDSRVLFERKAFANKSLKQVSDLRDIGERILNQCRGLPLKINTLASLLATMNKRSQWDSVDRSQVWNLFRFNRLPNVSIKRCFAHCSILIPKWEYVSEGYLISSWISHGFIQLQETSDLDLWAIGRWYIKYMCDHDLLMSYKDDGNGQHITLHYLMDGLAFYVSGDKYLSIRQPNDLRKVSSGVEHVSIHGGRTFKSLPNFPNNNARCTLRTLFCANATIPMDLLVQARLLRHLELIDCGLKEIPTSIGRLKHLRRLGIKDNPIKCLPDSIGSLYNLQVLSVCGCDRLFELPQQVTKLLNLMWIETTEAVHIPKGLGQLTRLMYLPPVKPTTRDGSRIKELGIMKSLVGVLTIKQLENISCKEDAMEADLKTKSGIEVLNLEWSGEGNEQDIICTDDGEVMEGLQPHSNLKQLWVENFRGKIFSLWLSSWHCNVTDLTLLNCKRCEQLPTLGCLPCLTSLRIEGMESVEVIGRDFYDNTGSSHNEASESNVFPSLQVFRLSNMPKLKEWFDPSGSFASAFPCLEKLYITNCPLLVSVPSFFHSLWELIIEDVQQLTCLSEPLLKCTSLERIKIKGCKELVELPPTLQSLTWLMRLSIEHCNSLISLPDIESCVFLLELTVTHCPNLNFNTDLAFSRDLRYLNFSYLSKQMSVPRGLNHISYLTDMFIGGFNDELNNIQGFEHLPKSLKSLTLVGWPKLNSLPDELQSFTQLEALTLWDFDGVTALSEWLGNLSSLQYLKIMNCKNMKHLPSLDAMRSLVRLEKLEIKECPLLEERCRKEVGEEWSKISHILDIQIGEAKAADNSSPADDGKGSRSRLTAARDAIAGWVKRRV